jgi:hypothetical protein
MRFSRSVAAVCAAASLLTPAAAGAACLQADLAGTWQAYALSHNASTDYWSRCKLTINTSGGIANTTCVSPLGNALLTNGHATLSAGSTCTFTAQFTLAGAVNRVVHGTINRDKLSGTGVGTFPGGVFLFTITKL